MRAKQGLPARFRGFKVKKLESLRRKAAVSMAMFGSEPRSATITASGNCVLYEIKTSDFSSRANGDVRKLSTALFLALSK